MNAKSYAGWLWHSKLLGAQEGTQARLSHRSRFVPSK
jgi:hypothetical protein